MSNGRGALFAAAESIAREEFIVAVDLDDREREAQIRLAAPLDKADLLEHFAADLRRADELAWDERTEAVVARRVIRFDELLVEEKPLNDVPRAASAAAMLEGVRSMGIDALPWDDDARDFQARCEFVRKLDRKDLGDWPDFSPPALAQDLAWLEPFLEGATRRSQLTRVPVLDALRARLSYEQQRKLEELAPTHIGLPTGSRARIDYLDDNAPVASMRMQEVFGLAATPRIGGGTVAGDVHAAVARAQAAADHARSRQLLAQRLRRGAQGHAWTISAALLAGESARGRADAAREAAGHVVAS